MDLVKRYKSVLRDRIWALTAICTVLWAFSYACLGNVAQGLTGIPLGFCNLIWARLDKDKPQKGQRLITYIAGVLILAVSVFKLYLAF